MALELDDRAHFATGIPSRDISVTASNTASRITGPYHGNRGTRRFAQPKPYAPAAKLSIVEHFPSAAGTSEMLFVTSGYANCAHSSAPMCTCDRLQPCFS